MDTVKGYAKGIAFSLVAAGKQGKTKAVTTVIAIASVYAIATNSSAAAQVIAESFAEAYPANVTNVYAGAQASAFTFDQAPASTETFSSALTIARSQNSNIKAAFSRAFAVASATASIRNRPAAARTLAQTAVQAVTLGNTQSFAASQAEALAYATTIEKGVESYAIAVAEAIQQGGKNAVTAYAAAFAQASASGGTQAAGLAQAATVVSCKGGASAEAFAQALPQTISRDSRGCRGLTETERG
eukprot:jgi/Chrzof1/4928/Cz15g04240.t1